MDILDAAFVAGATKLGQLPAPAFAEVAFAGRSNVGKSTLINRMVARKRLVRTSGRPGCTRAINVFRVTTREVTLDFVDLPGYGYARRSKAERASWGPLIEGFLQYRPGLRAVVVIVDVRRGLQEDDYQLLEFINTTPATPIVVATKVDKLPKSKMKSELMKLTRDTGLDVCGCSGETGAGREDLWARLLKASSLVQRDA
jgi:GTP-binding protein